MKISKKTLFELRLGVILVITLFVIQIVSLAKML